MQLPDAAMSGRIAKPPVSPGRAALAAGLWAVAIGLVVQATAARAAEAWLAAQLAALYVPGHTAATGDIFFAGLGTRLPIGLQITSECTVAILIVPMLLLAGIMSLHRRFGIGDILAGLGAGVAVDVGTNQVRMALIMWATGRYGTHAGYAVTHKLIGSVIAMLGFTVALVLMVRI